MKTYEVEFRITSYITLTVEAENVDDAKTKALARTETYNANINKVQWDIESIEEVEGE